MSADGSPSWEISQSLAANIPPGFSTRKMSANSASLSGTCSSASLEKTTSNRASSKGSRPGGACTKARAIRQTLRRRHSARLFDDRQFDIEAGNMTGSMMLHQMQGDPACPATKVQHAFAGKAQSFDDAVHLFRTAGRQIPLPPQCLEEADCGIVIFGFNGAGMRHLEWIQTNKIRHKPITAQTKTQAHLLNIHSIWLDMSGTRVAICRPFEDPQT